MTRRGGRFALVGAASTALHVFVATALIEFAQCATGVANGIAFAAATLASTGLLGQVGTVLALDDRPLSIKDNPSGAASARMPTRGFNVGTRIG